MKEAGWSIYVRTGESMTTIYLIRHAEAEGNLFRRAQGHWNGKLTERGRAQGRRPGGAL